MESLEELSNIRQFQNNMTASICPFEDLHWKWKAFIAGSWSFNGLRQRGSLHRYLVYRLIARCLVSQKPLPHPISGIALLGVATAFTDSQSPNSFSTQRLQHNISLVFGFVLSSSNIHGSKIGNIIDRSSTITLLFLEDIFRWTFESFSNETSASFLNFYLALSTNTTTSPRSTTEFSDNTISWIYFDKTLTRKFEKLLQHTSTLSLDFAFLTQWTKAPILTVKLRPIASSGLHQRGGHLVNWKASHLWSLFIAELPLEFLPVL